MRVLFYVGEAAWSGAARAVLAAARGLAARGHPVIVGCCPGSRLEAEAGAANLETLPIGPGSGAVSGAFDLRRVLLERFIEVAVVCSERDQLVVASAMRFAGRGAILRRLGAMEPLTLGSAGKLALRLASSGLVVSTERDLRETRVGTWAVPPAVVPHGVDATDYDRVEPATWHELGVPPNASVIACAYDPSGRYRMGVALRTLALLAPRHSRLHAVVFGPGAGDDDLRMHAAALGVTPIVRFLTECEDHRRIMRAAEAGWVAAGGDLAAWACLDFMALRVPVVAERSPLTQHFVADGITGLLLAPGDASYTASAVAAFLSSAANRAAMGNAGRTRTQRDFSESAMIDAFERAVNAAGDRTVWARR